jgi:hypothetical protein
LKKEESEVQKGFYKLSIGNEIKTDFIPLENIRKFFFEEISLNSDVTVRSQIEEKVEKIITQDFKRQPIIKIKIIGKEMGILEKELREIEKKYSDKAFINFSKELESPEMTRKIELLRDLRNRKLSVEEMGLQIFKKNIENLNFSSSFDSENIFKLLSDGETEKALDIITGKQTTLSSNFKAIE